MAGTRVLRLHMLISQIWTSTAPHREESKFDEFFPQFEEAIRIAETILGIVENARHSTEQYNSNASSAFLSDMEVITPVYFIGMNCRHPVLRRTAVAALKHTIRREGLWDSYKAAAVAERIMQIEQVHLTRFDGSELPAVEDRLHNTNMPSEPGMFPTRFRWTFHAKPDGLFGDWKRMWVQRLPVLLGCSASIP